MSEKPGIWIWAQPHCECGWIGTEVDEFTLENLESVVQELLNHMEDHKEWVKESELVATIKAHLRFYVNVRVESQ